MRFDDGRIAECWFHSRDQYEVDKFWAEESTQQKGETDEHPGA
jgi:hypothetical protein